MFGRISTFAASILALSACATPREAPSDSRLPYNGWAQSCENWDDWDKSGPPFRVHGNTYYVGTCGISSILVTGGDGHALIDSGTAAGAEIVLGNIDRLGLHTDDIALLLSSHEHHDHVGGMAKIQQRTNARYFSSPQSVANMSSGRPSPEDPQYGTLEAFEPVSVAGIAASGTPVTFGSISITPIATPGHTPGALSWTWQSCEGDDCKTIVYADSLSPISADGYRFSDHPEYVASYRAGLVELADLPCDILLTSHPSASWQHQRMASDAGLADPTACRRYAQAIEKRLDERLAEEAGG